MANTNAPFGFRPVRSLSGGAVIVNYYTVGSSASRIGKGDLVKFSSGKIVREASSVAVGPFVGVAMIDSGILAVGGIASFPVCDDPNAIFQVQASTATLATLGTLLKANCATAPNSSTGISQDLLSATASSATTGIRVIRVSTEADTVSGPSAIVEVRINNDIYNGQTS